MLCTNNSKKVPVKLLAFTPGDTPFTCQFHFHKPFMMSIWKNNISIEFSLFSVQHLFKNKLDLPNQVCNFKKKSKKWNETKIKLLNSHYINAVIYLCQNSTNISFTIWMLPKAIWVSFHIYLLIIKFFLSCH